MVEKKKGKKKKRRGRFLKNFKVDEHKAQVRSLPDHRTTGMGWVHECCSSAFVLTSNPNPQIGQHKGARRAPLS